jgi:hypothetical protein
MHKIQKYQKMNSEENQSLWKEVDPDEYQVTIHFTV